MTILLVFAPECGWCKKNLPNWKALINSLSRNSFRFIAVSTAREGVGNYIRNYGMNQIPVIAEADARDKMAYKLTGTPLTILVRSNGIVEKVWPGAFLDKAKSRS